MSSDGASHAFVTAMGVVIVWAVAGGVVAGRQPDEPLGTLMAGAAAIGGVALLADGHGLDDLRSISALALPAIGLYLTLSLPEGRLLTNLRRALVVGGLGAALLVGSLAASSQTWNLGASVVVTSVVATLIGVAGYVDRCRRAGPVDRALLQWVGWGVIVAGAVALSMWTLYELVGWPGAPGVVALGATALVPLSIACGVRERAVVRIDRLLTNTIVVAGIVTMVGALYLFVVLGLGRAPGNDDERQLLGLSLVAAAIAAVSVVPVRSWLDEFANQRVYGERRSPDEAMQTFGSRMSRAVPMDELLLQLVESLKKSMQLSAAEIWTGGDGVLERTVSVPDRGTRRIVLSSEELPVVARAHVSGNAWLAVWVPALLDDQREALVRVASVVHSGALLGLIVVERPGDAIPFSDDEERALTELARQVGLALHNVRLDSALQASLDELQSQADELRKSRSRIVTAADQSRRQIERNLHDGAQQYLVAIAVKLGLARQLFDSDPPAVAQLLDELRVDAQSTLTELRELAHGIYPPLLMDRGLPEALRAAANRSVLSTDVAADGVGRHHPEAEAAVYFCCLEAIQNAGKHAGSTARVDVRVWEEDELLHFEVADNGSGFDASSAAASGHGFVNMMDRVGAIGGTLEVDAAPGAGTRIRGAIPVAVGA